MVIHVKRRGWSNHFVYAIAHDGDRAAQLAENNGMLLLVSTLADVPWCAALGLVAATTGGMEALTAEQVRQLDQLSRCQTPLLETRTPQRPVDSVGDLETGDVVNTAELDETPPGTTGEERIGLQVAELPLELVISAWSLSDARAVDPPRLRRLAERLIRADRCLGLGLDRIGVWRPSAEEEATFAMCAEFRDATALHQAVLASLNTSTFHLETLTAADPPADFLTARTVLLEQLQRGAANHRLQAQASEDYQRSVEQQIVAPLLQRGLEATNPIAGALQLELAQLTGLLQRQAPRLLRELTSASADGFAAQANTQPQRDWHQNIRIYLQLIDRLVKLAKAIPT